MDIKKGQAFLDLFEGFELTGKHVEVYHKKISELSHVFKDRKAAQSMKEVEAYRVASLGLKDAGNESLLFGVTYLQPVTVNGECTLTRGHFHEDKEYGEIYIGLTGHGYLIKWDGDKELIIEDVIPGSIHIIDGKYAHRLVNIADEETAVGAVWSPNAGHNYKEIEGKGFPIRIFKKNNAIRIENPEEN